jgi:hypothetical protein
MYGRVKPGWRSLATGICAPRWLKRLDIPKSPRSATLEIEADNAGRVSTFRQKSPFITGEMCQPGLILREFLTPF